MLGSYTNSHLGAVANPPFLQLLDVMKPLGSRVQLFEKVDLQQPHLKLRL
jgi:hypothetical protein